MAATCSKCGTEHDNWTPAGRMGEMADQRRQALAEAEAARAKVDGLNAQIEAAKAEAAKAKAELQSQFDSQLQGWESKASSWQTERAALLAGITDEEGLGVVSTLWSTVPEDQRPEGGISAWLASESAPKAVRAYLPQAQTSTSNAEVTSTETTQVETGAAPKPKPLPASNTGAVQTNTTTSQYDASAISQMSLEEYRERRALIMAEKG